MRQDVVVEVAPVLTMDESAELAGKEFRLDWSAREVAAWWRKWYKTAGHKRLGRFLAGVK